MNYDRPPLIDHLAAAYVLGTLSARARRRFERLCRTLPSAADAVRDWERRLGGLAEPVPPVAPSPQLWLAIERRTLGVREHPETARQPEARTRRERSESSRLGDWLRPLLGFACGLLLAVGLVRLYPQGFVPGEPVDETALPASYIGLLTNAEGQPVLLASIRRHGRELQFKVLKPLTVPAGKVAVLWALAPNAAPAVVGVVPFAGGETAAPLAKATLTLAGSAEQLLSNVPKLALSFESAPPAAGAAPSPFALEGNCVKLW